MRRRVIEVALSEKKVNSNSKGCTYGDEKSMFAFDLTKIGEHSK